MLTDAKHGRWSYRISNGFDPVTGKRRPQINGKSFPTRTAALKARNEDAVKRDRGTYKAPDRETLAQYLPAWLERRQGGAKPYAPTTLENYARYIRQDIAPSRLGQMRLGDIRRADVVDFIGSMRAAGRGPVTIRRMVAVLQAALTKAVEDERIGANPAHRVAGELPEHVREDFQPWQPEHVGAFLDTAAQHRLGVLFEVAVLTGLRRAELVALQWADVDLERATLTVRKSKTDAGRRTVPLANDAIGSLLAWQIAQGAERDAWGEAYAGSGHVFTMEDGRPLKLQYVTRLFDALRLQADLPKSTMHSLRHQFAALQIAAGTPLSVVSKVMGHASVSITSDTYSHLVHDTTRDALNAGAALIHRQSAASKIEGVHTLHAQPALDTKETVPVNHRNRL